MTDVKSRRQRRILVSCEANPRRSRQGLVHLRIPHIQDLVGTHLESFQNPFHGLGVWLGKTDIGCRNHEIEILLEAEVGQNLARGHCPIGGHGYAVSVPGRCQEFHQAGFEFEVHVECLEIDGLSVIPCLPKIQRLREQKVKRLLDRMHVNEVLLIGAHGRTTDDVQYVGIEARVGFARVKEDSVAVENEHLKCVALRRSIGAVVRDRPSAAHNLGVAWVHGRGHSFLRPFLVTFTYGK